jgi:hypothetical protein
MGIKHSTLVINVFEVTVHLSAQESFGDGVRLISGDLDSPTRLRVDLDCHRAAIWTVVRTRDVNALQLD